MFPAKLGQTLFYPPTPLLLTTPIKAPNSAPAHSPPGNCAGKEQESDLAKARAGLGFV